MLNNMNKEEFRIKHSQLIEQYQLVEFHLEGLFAIMQHDGDNFRELARRVENDAMGELIRKVRFLVKEKKHQDLLTKQDFGQLENVRDDRNFWCHSNFLELNKNPNLYEKHCLKIAEDLKRAISINDKLKNVFQKLI